MAAATAAFASLFIASVVLLGTEGARRVASVFAGVCLFSARILPEVEGNAPLTGTAGFVAGLWRGIAGMMRAFFGPGGGGLLIKKFSLPAGRAGGASAAAMSGFDSVGGGGGGPLTANVVEPGVVDALGNLTVAVGFSGVSCCCIGFSCLFAAGAVTTTDC